MPTKLVYSKRKFLNRKGHHSTASIFAEIIRTSCRREDNKKYSVWHDIELKLSDCDRFINLDLSLGNKSAKTNSIQKLDILISVLTELKQKIIEIKK